MTLSESMVKELIPKVGLRSKFINQLNILKQNVQIEIGTYIKYSLNIRILKNLFCFIRML